MYLTPEKESWKPIEMRKSRFGSKQVENCECTEHSTCGPCLDDHVRRMREGK